MSEHDFHRAIEEAAGQPDVGVLAEFWQFVRENRKWWLLPIVAVLAMFGLVLALASSNAASLLYTLF